MIEKNGLKSNVRTKAAVRRFSEIHITEKMLKLKSYKRIAANPIQIYLIILRTINWGQATKIFFVCVPHLATLLCNLKANFTYIHPYGGIQTHDLLDVNLQP